VKVTDPDGKILFTSNFEAGTNGWRFLGSGKWDVQNGALRQTAEQESVRALAGGVEWSDYTLTLKARKLAGQEGFLILFHIADDEDHTWWNVGGWQNTGDGVENDQTIDKHPAYIETGRWYDLKLQVRGKRVQCYVDGRLMHDVNFETRRDVRSLYASASKDVQSGDVILKVVNVSEKPLTTKIEFKGDSKLTGQGTAFVLTSENGKDENSLSDSRRVSPVTLPLSFQPGTFTRQFEGNSVTVLRLAAAKGR
jgi:alpha-L-arabinofuranosidase